MGCVSSRARTPRSVWDVMNIDEYGNRLLPGKIEVTRTDLILHQKGKPSVYWPLKCLRRYGFDSELFSFESGRRCSTGPGVFAFKCRKAFEIFNLLHGHLRQEQSHVLAANNSNSSTTNVTPGMTNATIIAADTAATTAIGAADVLRNQVTSLVARRRHNAFVPTLPQDMLDNWVASTEPPLSPPPFSDVVTPTYQNFPGPTYMNVCVQRDSMDSGNGPNYVNVDTNSRRDSAASSENSEQGINYVELDLDRNSDSGGEQATVAATAAIAAAAANASCVGGAAAEAAEAVTEPVLLPPRSYATIDFERTVALSTFANSSPDDENPTRKTRHDSVCPVPRSSISND